MGSTPHHAHDDLTAATTSASTELVHAAADARAPSPAISVVVSPGAGDACCGPTPTPTPDERTSLLERTRASVQSLAPQVDKVRSFVDDFQEFIQQGSMVDLAVGLILGKSFSVILDSFVSDMLTPVLSLFSQRNLSNYYIVARCPPLVMHCSSSTWPTWAKARSAGAITINYGQFMENLINFLINAMFLYIAIKKVFELLFHRAIILKRQCPACKEFVRGNAIICKECGTRFE